MQNSSSAGALAEARDGIALERVDTQRNHQGLGRDGRVIKEAVAAEKVHPGVLVIEDGDHVKLRARQHMGQGDPGMGALCHNLLV